LAIFKLNLLVLGLPILHARILLCTTAGYLASLAVIKANDALCANMNPPNLVFSSKSLILDF